MKFRVYITALVVLACAQACKKPHAPTDLSGQVLIPKPVSVTSTGTAFALVATTEIFVDQSAPEIASAGEYLAAKLRPSTGFGLKVTPTSAEPASGNIYLAIQKSNLPAGGYELVITEQSVKLTSNDADGLFNGVQTIRQLFPDKIELGSVQQGPFELATGTIRDYPAYAFRGSMIDLGRHFFSVEDVKRYIDLIAAYKMNIMHLHLTDDQGWRIEIKSWPNLTTHGGSTEVGKGKGGFYTQEQYKDIVKYAMDRHITIIPEIDTPGHTNAALSSYPDLNCNGKAPELYTGTNVGFSTLCAQKEITYKFMDDVVRELAAITPGPWIHIGGDESHATKKEDYILYINKVQDIVKAHGKVMIGWDEISQANLTGTTVAQFWTNEKFAKAAVDKGAKLIMSPAKRVYVDMSYDTTTKLGQHWAAYIEVDSAYRWDPATYVKGIGKSDILGIESPLWTETITNMEDIEYMVFPRMAGYAEIAWSPSEGRSWDEYKVRLGKHSGRFKALDINFYRSRLVPWVEAVDPPVK